VRLLEDKGYEGPRHFDAHAYRSEDEDGVWDFAAGCMRNYLIFKEKARAFNEDKDIQALLTEIRDTDPAFEPIPVKFTKERAEKIKSLNLDRVALAKKRLPYEKLDQLVIDLLLGVR
jgi:xylose isomerase